MWSVVLIVVACVALLAGVGVVLIAIRPAATPAEGGGPPVPAARRPR